MSEVCANAYNHRNGQTYTISQMVGSELVPWVKIRPTDMSQTGPTKPIITRLVITEAIGGARIWEGWTIEGREIDLDMSKFVNETDINSALVSLSNANINMGTMDIRCCMSFINLTTSLNVSIYDENKSGVEMASVVYGGQTNSTSSSGFASFRVLATTVSDMVINLPSGYNRAGESQFTLKNVAADQDEDPETPHTVYVQVQKADPTDPDKLTLSVPVLAMAGSDVKLVGTSPVPGLDVQIMGVKKLIGFDYLASDSVLSVTKAGADRHFSATIVLDEFGAVEIYAKTADLLNSSKHTILIVTPMILLALLAILAMVLDKKYNFIGMFKKKRGKK